MGRIEESAPRQMVFSIFHDKAAAMKTLDALKCSNASRCRAEFESAALLVKNGEGHLDLECLCTGTADTGTAEEWGGNGSTCPVADLASLKPLYGKFELAMCKDEALLVVVLPATQVGPVTAQLLSLSGQRLS
jgi:hypothetical protein